MVPKVWEAPITIAIRKLRQPDRPNFELARLGDRGGAQRWTYSLARPGSKTVRGPHPHNSEDPHAAVRERRSRRFDRCPDGRAAGDLAASLRTRIGRRDCGGPQQTASDIWGYGVVRHGSSSYTLREGRQELSWNGQLGRTLRRWHIRRLSAWHRSLARSMQGPHWCLRSAATGTTSAWRTISAGTAPDPAEIDVHCYDRSGVPTDGTYSASLLDSQSLTGKAGYVWANDATNPATYVPDGEYQYNSTGATDTVTRLSKGRYARSLSRPGDGPRQCPGWRPLHRHLGETGVVPRAQLGYRPRPTSS